MESALQLCGMYYPGRRQQEGWRPPSAFSLQVQETGAAGWTAGDTKATEAQTYYCHVNVPSWIMEGNTEVLALQMAVKYSPWHF